MQYPSLRLKKPRLRRLRDIENTASCPSCFRGERPWQKTDSEPEAKYIRIDQDLEYYKTGALYPALHRVERQGLIESEWGVSDNNRRAKYYKLTPLGRQRLREESAGWNRFSDAMAAALRAGTGAYLPPNTRKPGGQ